MGIGSSKGAFYEDEFRAEAAPWFIDPKDDKMVVTPNEQRQNKQLEQQDYSVMDGIEIGNLVPAPVEGTSEYSEWEKTWSEIHPLRNGETPEKFMGKIPDPDVEGFHDTSPNRNWMMLRKKVKPSLKLEDAVS